MARVQRKEGEVEFVLEVKSVVSVLGRVERRSGSGGVGSARKVSNDVSPLEDWVAHIVAPQRTLRVIRAALEQTVDNAFHGKEGRFHEKYSDDEREHGSNYELAGGGARERCPLVSAQSFLPTQQRILLRFISGHNLFGAPHYNKGHDIKEYAPVLGSYSSMYQLDTGWNGAPLTYVCIHNVLYR